ncbi:MAG: LicD family protein [Oscillospiraceae bacterium]|nr:LicD family protein [Oscillospiraceae bacterium]
MDKDRLSPQEIKNIEFELLKKFISFCDKYDLHYALTYGTLLGAVRHEGFIPWDDDIDVMMPREDYQKLIKACFEKCPIEGCELLGRDNTEGYFYPFLKLCDTNTIAKMDDNHTVHGIWIDIFPVDRVPDDEKKARKLHKHIRFCKNMVISYTTNFKAKHKNWKMIPKFFYKALAKMIGINKLVDHIENESQKFADADTHRVAIVNWQSSVGGNMDEKDFRAPEKVMFNGVEMNAPRNYDGYLRSIYGDYMSMPPKSKRAAHNVDAYYKQEAKTDNEKGV